MNEASGFDFERSSSDQLMARVIDAEAEKWGFAICSQL